MKKDYIAAFYLYTVCFARHLTALQRTSEESPVPFDKLRERLN